MYVVKVISFEGKPLIFHDVKEYSFEGNLIKFTDSKTGIIKRFSTTNCEIDEVMGW